MADKDRWDKVNIIGTILTPILLLVLGFFIQRGLPNNDQAARLAADILMSNPNTQAVELRHGALDVLEKSSKIEIPASVKEELAKHALAAQSQRFKETEIHFKVHCDGASTTCSDDFKTAFSAETPIQARVFLDSEVCQPLELEFLFNGNAVYESGTLRPGSSTQTSIVTLTPSASRPTQELVIKAQGLPAECSPDGKIQGRGGILTLLEPLPGISPANS